MEKVLVPYAQSLQLRELGFDEPCFGYYLCKNSAFGIYLEITSNWLDLLPYDSSSCKAPTFSQAFRWFREKYKLYPEIGLHDREDEETWRFTISILGYYELAYNQDISKETYYKTYEEAELACLEKLIELTKNKQ